METAFSLYSYFTGTPPNTQKQRIPIQHTIIKKSQQGGNQLAIYKLRTYVQKCMQWRKWRNWRKIASCWRFELDAKSGPLEVDDFGENGDFGEIGDFGKNRQRAGDMWQNIQI